MTILGKMLVFVVLVLSIVWNALVVNSYVARTNWQKRAAEYEKKAQDAATSATSMKALLEEERAAAAEARQAMPGRARPALRHQRPARQGPAGPDPSR